MKKIIILTNLIPHYRRDLFQNLLSNTDYKIEIIAGENYEDIKNVKGNYKTFQYKKFSFLKHKMYFLSKSIRYIKKKKPDAIICGGFDPHLIHTILIFFIYRLILRKPFYWWTHGTIGHQGYIGYLIRKFFYINSSGAFTYSRKGKESLLKMGLNKNKLKIIGNSINRDEYGYLNHKLVYKQKKIFNLLFTGRITKSKKIEILILALNYIFENNKNINIICTIVGGGNHMEKVKKLAKKHNLNSHILFTGEKYGDEITEYFLNADLFVYPGGIGLSIVQALSYGLPIITTDNFEIQGPEVELMEKGLNGNFYNDNSFVDLAEQILVWKKKIKNKKEEFMKKCINSIQKNEYLPNQVADSIIEFINQEQNNW